VRAADELASERASEQVAKERLSKTYDVPASASGGGGGDDSGDDGKRAGDGVRRRLMRTACDDVVQLRMDSGWAATGGRFLFRHETLHIVLSRVGARATHLAFSISLARYLAVALSRVRFAPGLRMLV